MINFVEYNTSRCKIINNFWDMQPAPIEGLQNKYLLKLLWMRWRIFGFRASFSKRRYLSDIWQKLLYDTLKLEVIFVRQWHLHCVSEQQFIWWRFPRKNDAPAEREENMYNGYKQCVRNTKVIRNGREWKNMWFFDILLYFFIFLSFEINK